MPIMSTGPPFSWSRLNRHLKAPRVMTAHGQLRPLPAGGIPESSLHVSLSPWWLWGNYHFFSCSLN